MSSARSFFMRILILLVGITFCFLNSCSSQLGSVAQLSYLMSEGAQGGKNNLYYQGSDDKFDYFLADRFMNKREIKLPKGKLKLDRQFEKSSDRRSWVRLDPYYPHSTFVRTPDIIDIRGL